MRIALGPRALLDQFHVEPLGRGFHCGDEGAQFGRRILNRLESLVAGAVEHVDQRAKAVFGHQRGIGVGGAVAGHGIGANGREAFTVGEQFGSARGKARGHLDPVGEVGGEAFGQPREIDRAIDRGDRLALRHYLGRKGCGYGFERFDVRKRGHEAAPFTRQFISLDQTVKGEDLASNGKVAILPSTTSSMVVPTLARLRTRPGRPVP